MELAIKPLHHNLFKRTGNPCPMAFVQTWEPMEELPTPVPVSELEVVINTGDEFNLGFKRPELYAEALNYWDEAQIRQVNARAREYAAALAANDQKQIARMQAQIGGVQPKQSCSRARFSDHKLYLAMNSVSYMDMIGTNEQAIANPPFRARLMQAGLEDYTDENRYFANPLAVCTAVCGFPDRDNPEDMYVVLTLRSDKVMIYPNVHHVIGGMVDVSRDGKQVNIGAEVYRELKEEMGRSEERMGIPRLKAIIRQVPSRIPEAVCFTPVYLSQQELQHSWQTKSPGKFEHRNLLFYHADQLPRFLDQFGDTMVPSGQAALMYLLRAQQSAEAVQALVA